MSIVAERDLVVKYERNQQRMALKRIYALYRISSLIAVNDNIPYRSEQHFEIYVQLVGFFLPDFFIMAYHEEIWEGYGEAEPLWVQIIHQRKHEDAERRGWVFIPYEMITIQPNRPELAKMIRQNLARHPKKRWLKSQHCRRSPRWPRLP